MDEAEKNVRQVAHQQQQHTQRKTTWKSISENIVGAIAKREEHEANANEDRKQNHEKKECCVYQLTYKNHSTKKSKYDQRIEITTTTKEQKK